MELKLFTQVPGVNHVGGRVKYAGVAFEEWYIHQHHHSAIRFITPQQRPSGAATAIGEDESGLMNAPVNTMHADRHEPTIRCWNQPAVAEINQPTNDTTAEDDLLLHQAA